MRRGSWTNAASRALLIALAIGAVACGPSGPTEEELAAAASAEEWQWLSDAKSKLDAQRAELARLQQQGSEAVDEAADAVEEGATEGAASVEDQIATLTGEISAVGDEFLSRLIGFINDQGITVGGELTDVQKGAIRMKSSEEMLLAQEYIDRGGDYVKAMEIYNQSLQFDPDNEELKAALAAAEANQYMTEERFALVKKKMTQDQVRAAIGQVNLRNIKPYEEEGTIAWFYRKEDGGAAGVWFKESKKGADDWFVYTTKFDAVKPAES